MIMNPAKVHYTHSLSYSAKDRLVGMFMMVAIVAMIGLFIAKVKTSKMFADVVHYHTYMKTAQGISTDTIVNISGIDVGKVSALDIDDNNRIHIHFFVYKDFQKLLRTDSKGELNKLSLVGNAVIIIKAGSADKPILPDGAIINVEEPVTTDDLIAGVTPVIKDLETLIDNLSKIISAINPKAVQETTHDLRAVVGNVRELSDHVNQGKGSLGRILYDKNQEQSVNNSLLLIEKNLAAILQRVNETQPVIENVNKLSVQSQQMMGDVRQSLHKVDKQLDQIPSLLNNGQSVLKNTQSVLDTSEQTIKGVQKIWPLSSALTPPSNELLIKERGLDE
jgi:phospholipid/cholesterol/gamma-HCH transport system substrate-binding protein